MATVYEFGLHDQLPTYYDVISAIISLSPGGNPSKETKLRTTVINAYTKDLAQLWYKSFTKEHVQSLTTIKKKVRHELVKYHKMVQMSKQNKRQSQRIWRESLPGLFDVKKESSDPYKFDEAERLFYFDQSKDRKMYLSEEIDVQFEVERESEKEKEQLEKSIQEEEMSFIFEEEQTQPLPSNSSMNSVQLSQSVNRSGTVRMAPMCDNKSVQTEDKVETRPAIRKQRDCTDAIKSACAQVSTRCGISAEKARIAVQTTCKYIYHHDFYLQCDDQNDDECEEPVEKKSKQQPGSVPTTKDNYMKYKYVLPSARTIIEYKHQQAAQEERDAALALVNKPVSVKVSLHFDTTSRNHIDGEWPSLILIFSDGKRFRLRPIFFAYEDRDNIVRLIVETYTRLAVAATIISQINVSPEDLWKKTNVLMTDAVTKNLEIENGVAMQLNSSHIPMHLLCKSHTVEKLDKCNLTVLAEIEQKLKLREKLEAINPSLRPFYRGKKAVVEAGITSILKLVTHDKSGNSTSLAEEFDFICEKEQQVKHMSLYRERRFTKLGYSAASILHAYPLLQKLLTETSKSNLLVEACKLYLSCEFFLTELKVLAFFTHKVTLPFLNMVEKSDQETLLTTLPQLCNDLRNGNTDTLKDYIVIYKHVPVSCELTEVEEEIVNELCISAAEGIDLQCSREYGFAKVDQKPRATDLSKLSKEELVDLPTNNLSAERDLAKFSKLAVVAKYRNKNFKARGIQTDMVLYQSEQGGIEHLTTKIHKALCLRDTEWTQSQKELKKKRILEKMTKQGKEHDYSIKLLQGCKTWGGPCTSADELAAVLQGRPDNAEKIVKTELAYYRKTHKSDMNARPELFKLIRIGHQERLENLFILLNDSNQVATASSASIVDLPSDQDALQVIRGSKKSVDHSQVDDVELNELRIILWNVDGEMKWFVGYVKEKAQGDLYIVEHLERVVLGKDIHWRYPKQDDIQSVHRDQIMVCKVDGEWDITTNTRVMKFVLKNALPINNVFRKLLK